MEKVNCWEMLDCGREPSGRNADNPCECAAPRDVAYDGVNYGQNAGRICWRVAGTCCNDELQGTFAQKAEDCGRCVFFNRVRDEEGDALVL